MFTTRDLFNVYEGKRVVIQEVEAGINSQGDVERNRALVKGKLDVDEVVNKIKDRRYKLED
jgi:hypothetical protein